MGDTRRRAEPRHHCAREDPPLRRSLNDHHEPRMRRQPELRIEQAQKRGFNLICADQGFDLGTPEGKLFANILAGFAEFEADLISARTRAGLEGARLRGRYAGNPAFGRVPEDVRMRIRMLRASGLGLERIAETLNREHVPTARGGRWTKGTIAAILKRSRPLAVTAAQTR
jgi:DNA invertase Pin-like site-specific DNA recombinase